MCRAGSEGKAYKMYLHVTRLLIRKCILHTHTNVAAVSLRAAHPILAVFNYLYRNVAAFAQSRGGRDSISRALGFNLIFHKTNLKPLKLGASSVVQCVVTSCFLT